MATWPARCTWARRPCGCATKGPAAPWTRRAAVGTAPRQLSRGHASAHALAPPRGRQLAAQLRGADTVVLHCGKSVQRGPHAANRYEEARARLAAAGDAALAAQRVVLLEGGFAAFAACPAAQGLLAADSDRAAK